MRRLPSMAMIILISMAVIIFLGSMQLGTVSAEVSQATIELQVKCSANEFAMWMICLLLFFYIVVLSYVWTTNKDWKLSQAFSEIAIFGNYDLMNSLSKIKISIDQIPNKLTKVKAKITNKVSQEITNQLIQKYNGLSQKDEEISHEVAKEIIDQLNQKDKQLSQEINNRLIQTYQELSQELTKQLSQKVSNQLVQKYNKLNLEITKLSTAFKNFNKEEAKPRLVASSSRFLAFIGLIMISGMLLISSFYIVWSLFTCQPLKPLSDLGTLN